MWAELGAETLDADRVAHEQMEPGHAVYDSLVERFGRGILDSEGRVDRARLGQVVFAGETARLSLNALAHPPVIAHVRAWLNEVAARDGVAVAQIPLLFEVGMERDVDTVVCVITDEARVMERLAARGLTPEESRRRIASQWPVREKAARSDFVIENNGTLEQLKERADKVYQAILKKERT